MKIDFEDVEKTFIENNVDFKGKKILDVGCGDGRLSPIFNTAERYVGIDTSKENIEKAKQKNPALEYHFVSADKFEYGEMFDIAFFNLTWHEIEADLQLPAMNNILQLLKENGEIIIMDPKLEHEEVQFLYNVGYRNFQNINHDEHILHSLKILKQLEEENKIKLLEKKEINIPWEFKNKEELYEFMKGEFKKDFDPNKEQLFIKEINEVLKEKVDNNPIIVYDELDFFRYQKV